MKILLVNWLDLANPQGGGAEIHAFELFSRLAKWGHSVRLVCSGWPGGPRRAVVDGIDVTRVSTRYGFALAGRAAVRRALAEETPDILVEDINKIPLFTAGLTDRPFCAIVPHLFGGTAFNEAPWPIAAAVWLAERPLARAYRRAGFHAISESTRDDLVARGVRAECIRVIHPGVDSAWFTPDPGTPRRVPPAFLYIGRLRRYKGVDIAIRAFARAHRERPDLRFDIAGTGDTRPALEQLVAELGLGEAVTFHGYVTEAQKLDLLRSTTANIFPSPKEGWGITVVEAAACGTPSIASDSPGLQDSVRHGETGFLVPHGDEAALAARMLELAGSPRLVAQLGAAARAFAGTLTWDHAARETEQHLTDIINGSACG
ncbi:MAG TPA: glycosyltransferase family 4 protein [Gemmatimonadales bacterium]